MKRDAPYSIPGTPGRWRAITLAVVVHLALLAFLWIGVRWQSETPAGVEAEIWSPQNREAAPARETPPAPPQPPAPPPKPAVQEPPPKPPVAEPVQENPDIALEQEKKRKEQQRREAEQEREKQARLKQEREEHERAEKQKQLEQQRAEKEKLEKQKAAEEKARKEKEEQAKKEQAKKLAAEKAASEKRRADDLKRLMAQAGTGGSGSAATTQGSRADGEYGAKVAARIRSNTVFNVPDSLAGNPEVNFTVELLPDGSIRSLRKLKSSGVPGFDEAVQRAIERSAPFPPDKSGKVPSGFNLIHHPKDQ